MKKDTVLVAVCNQKGGVGKSTMTIMLAGYYHYLKGLNVAVIDCDYPQYSLVRMKERDMRTVENSDYFKQLLKSQYERIRKKAYTIVGSKAENARDAAEKLMNNGNYDLIIVDLPGTVNSSGVINTIVNMDYVITPIIPDAKIGIYGIGYHHPGNQPLQQGTILDNPKLLSLYLVSSSGQIVEG